MEKLHEFHEQAQECRALAAKAKDSGYRSQLLDLAARWESLAEEREKLLEVQKRLQQSS